MAAGTLEIDREAIKTLAIAVGVREAARQTGISEDRVRQWSSREKWFKPASPLPPTVTKNHVTAVTKPSDALSNMLADDALQTKVGLSQAGRKVATYLSAKSPETLIERDISQSARNWTDVASKVHGWDADKREGDKIMINIGILGQ